VFSKPKTHDFETCMKQEASIKSVLTHENAFSVSRVGSALEADKKINLALKISVNVHVPEAPRKATQRRPPDVRGDDLYPAGGLPLARSASDLRTLEFCLHPLASLVSGGLVGKVATDSGRQSAGPIAVSGRQSHQGASRCEQSRWWSTKPSHWAHQRWVEHQAQCLGGRARTSRQLELGTWAGSRRCGRASISSPKVARCHYRGRQGLRQRRFPNRIAAVGKSCLHSASFKPAPTSQLASWTLSQAAQGRKFIPALETSPQNRNAL
jgi:hypothetical protein